MSDRVFEGFLKKQEEEGRTLARASDLVQLTPMDGPLPTHYVTTFYCKGLVVSPQGRVVEGERFVTGYYFPPDYLRVVQPAQIVVLFEPKRTWHPNIRAPFICLGHIAPGTPLVELIYRTFELITYTKCTMREDNALNPEACAWARQNQLRFPLDRRPLKRRSIRMDTAEMSKRSNGDRS